MKGDTTVKIDKNKPKDKVEYCYDRVDESFLTQMESIVGVKLGKQLKEYILKYCFMARGHIEMLGVTNAQKADSDMIQRTLRLHEQFDVTKGLVAIEDCGDGEFYLVDSNDDVYRFVAGNNELAAMDIKLDWYIIKRFI